MNNKLLQFILLFTLSFNIAHDTILLIENDCQNESINQYIEEQVIASECDNLCDVHHLFHFMAILDLDDIALYYIQVKAYQSHKITFYNPPQSTTNIKPPIV